MLEGTEMVARVPGDVHCPLGAPVCRSEEVGAIDPERWRVRASEHWGRPINIAAGCSAAWWHAVWCWAKIGRRKER